MTRGRHVRQASERQRAVRIVVVTALLLVVSAASAVSVFDRLQVGGFYAAQDEATRADAAVEAHIEDGPHNLVIMATAGDVDAPSAAADGRRLAAQLRSTEGIAAVDSYWEAEAAALRADDRGSALVLARITGDEDERKATLNRIYDDVHGRYGDLQLALGGQPAIEREVTARSEEDLRRMELLATPVVALVLVLIFGSLVASLLPLVIGLCAIVGTLVTLRLLTSVTSVSMYSLNIATALSLGLAIDYGLFMVTRFREQLDAGDDVPLAVRTTVQTAGRTILFSALTVAVSLSALLVFPLYYLRSFAYAGIAVVGFAALSAVVVLPAVLLLVGHRVDRLDVVQGMRRRLGLAPHPGGRLAGDEGSSWHRVASAVMRRPVLIGTAALTMLLVLGMPFLGARYALPDATNLPRDSESAQVVSSLRSDYPDLPVDGMYVVSDGRALTMSEAAELAGQISTVPGVSAVSSAAGVFADGRQAAPAGPEAARYSGADASWLGVTLTADPQSEAAEEAVADVRALDAPTPVVVGGVAAHLVDTRSSLSAALPWGLLIVASATLVLLFLFTGSVLIPVKAVVLNLISLGATLGAVVWIFQDGHLRWLLGDFQTNGAIELTTPILLFAIAFGLSMDYELFLLSRIKEEWESRRDNTAAVAAGLARTGRLVTSAAVLFVIVMVAFATSSLGVLKLVGVGLGLAVVLDATVVRALLVPAIMRLAGRANWWAPRPLRALHARVGLAESAPAVDPTYDAPP